MHRVLIKCICGLSEEVYVFIGILGSEVVLTINFLSFKCAIIYKRFKKRITGKLTTQSIKVIDNDYLQQSMIRSQLYFIAFVFLAHSHIIVYLMCSQTLLTKLYLVSTICGMSVLSILSPLRLQKLFSSLFRAWIPLIRSGFTGESHSSLLTWIVLGIKDK